MIDSNNHPLVSIIVPCYNYAHFLGEALVSVLAQSYPHWECIIVNDGSPDNTQEVAMEYCKKDERFKYFYKENGGHSSARNFGIKHSSGKYILPLDADDFISEIYIEKAVDILEKDEQTKLVTGDVQLFGTNDLKISYSAFNLRNLLIENYITISSLFRRADFDKTNGFDESLMAFEDWDLFISILKNGGVVKTLPFTSLFYRKKEISTYENVIKDTRQSFKDLLKLYNNHVDIYEKFFRSPIELIQENEKMTRVISGYQQSRTYRLGLIIKRIKNTFKLNK